MIANLLLMVLLKRIHIVALYAGYNRQNTPQLSAHYGPILFHSLDEALLCGLPCSFLLRH